MILVLGNKAFPQLYIFLSELARTWLHDIVRKYIVIPHSRHDGDRQWIPFAAVPEDLYHLVDGSFVGSIDFSRGTGNLDILIVPRRVAGPDDKIDLLVTPDSWSAPTRRASKAGAEAYVFQILVDPPKRLVDKSPRRITGTLRYSIRSGDTLSAVALLVRVGARLVVVVRMDIYRHNDCNQSLS
jgi:hypothetical protein